MNSNPKPKPWEVEKESSEDLLVILSMNEDSPKEASLAFNEFFKRFSKFVWQQSQSISTNLPWPAEDLARAILSNTFLKVQAKAGAYDPKKNSTTNADHGIELWLSGIIKNEYKQLVSHSSEDQKDAKEDYLRVAYKTEEAFNDPFEEEDEETVSIERACLELSLAQLKDREKDVLLTYFRYKDGNKQLPRPEIDRLANLYNTTAVNLRKIKERTVKQLEILARNCKKNT